jgi:hypothetical protein
LGAKPAPEFSFGIFAAAGFPHAENNEPDWACPERYVTIARPSISGFVFFFTENRPGVPLAETSALEREFRRRGVTKSAPERFLGIRAMPGLSHAAVLRATELCEFDAVAGEKASVAACRRYQHDPATRHTRNTHTRNHIQSSKMLEKRKQAPEWGFL